jgi:hypothetical protein
VHPLHVDPHFGCVGRAPAVDGSGHDPALPPPSANHDRAARAKEIRMPTQILVFDPAMCCSTGVCGPSVDPELVRFATDLGWLRSQGVAVERLSLSRQPAAFADDTAVKAALETKGEAALPLVKVNGEVKSSGVYPSRDELAAWAGVAAPAPSLVDEASSGGCCGPAKSGCC